MKKSAPASYTVTFDGRNYTAACGRIVYTLPACPCVSHPGECPPRVAAAHLAYKPGTPRSGDWTREMVDTLMTCVASGKAPTPRRSKYDPKLVAHNVVGSKAPKTDPTPEMVAELQALCDAAAARGGA